MQYDKKTWENRESEYPNRYTMTSANGNVADVSIVPKSGAVSVEGEPFDADTMNDLEDRIEQGFIDISEDLSDQATSLNNSIDSEITRATAAEEGITTNLGLLDTKVDNEISRAVNKETSIEAELTRYEGVTDGAISTINGQLTSIGSNASSALSLAQDATSNITVESNRAQQTETSLQGNIDTVSSAISGEVSRATTAENALDTRVTNIERTVTRAYKASGSIYFADLPSLAEERIGNVYNIKDDFITTSEFIEGAGKSFPAGTNVAIEQIEEINYTEITPVGDENPSEEGWYEYDETEEEYFLSEDTEVDGTKTYYVRTDYALYYDIPSGFIDTSDFVSNTDYATSSNAGIVKPDGTTITIDNDGTIHGAPQGSSGHTILDKDGTSYTQRDALQFDDAIISDDSVNGKTVIKSNIFEGTRAGWEALSLAEKAKYKYMFFKNEPDGIQFDAQPTPNSDNLVRSGGIYSYIDTMITSALNSSY